MFIYNYKTATTSFEGKTVLKRLWGGFFKDQAFSLNRWSGCCCLDILLQFFNWILPLNSS
ncbi:MAG TPA: hypothetical protein DCR48_02330 [Flavobacteriales bacterium]|nr:hypothetical protein [Flavobacteriales bacterium]